MWRAFGEEGDFDRWAMPGEVNLRLMEAALKRGRPVTRADLNRVHEALYHEPLPDDPPADAVT